MRVQALAAAGRGLAAEERPVPAPAPGQLRVAVAACGVCRTDLHVVDGELPDPKARVVPGHEIVGRVEALGEGADGFALGERVGIPWLGWTCGECRFCRRGQENLCAAARFTGYTLDGGYAEHAVADARYCFRLPAAYGDVEAAPLLCAGLIGYRALRLAGEARRVGLYGFGAAAHLLAQLCVRQGREVYAFVRPGDERGCAFARELGAGWCGSSGELPPQPLDAALLFAPVGALVPAALRAVDRGGVVVCAGIHMSEIPSFPYELLWGERSVRSVANLTREDGVAFFAELERHPVRTVVTKYELTQASRALADLRAGRVEGAAVLVP
jgi:propanol-preferring alcohol dehydrogenase